MRSLPPSLTVGRILASPWDPLDWGGGECLPWGLPGPLLGVHPFLIGSHCCAVTAPPGHNHTLAHSHPLMLPTALPWEALPCQPLGQDLMG